MQIRWGILFLLLALAGVSYSAEYEVVGKVLSVSNIPEAAKSAYPDCNYTMEFEVGGIFGGDAVPRRITLVLPAFRDRKVVREATFKPDSLVKAVICKYDDAPSDIRKIQQADDLNHFMLEIYYALKSENIKEIKLSKDMRAPDWVDIRPRPQKESINPPLPAASVAGRTQAAARDLSVTSQTFKRTAAERAALDREFRRKRAVSSPESRNGNMVLRTAGPHKSFFTMRDNYSIFKPYNKKLFNKEHIAGIIGLNEYLKFHNIDLICVPIPLSGEVAFGELFPEYKNSCSEEHLKLLELLLENGIEAVDILPELKRRSHDYKLMFYYHLFDWHPHVGTVDVATDIVAGRLKRYNLAAAKGVFSKTYVENSGWLSCKDNVFDIADVNREPDILFNGKPLILPSSGQEIVVMGNSFAETPAAAKQSFAKFLALKTGATPAYMQSSGNGVLEILPKHMLLNEAKYLTGVKAVVLVAGANYFFCGRDIRETRGDLVALSKLDKIELIPNESLSIADAPGAIDENAAAKWLRRGLSPCWVELREKEKSRVVLSLPDKVYDEIRRNNRSVGVEFDYYNLSAPESYFQIAGKIEKRTGISGSEIFVVPPENMTQTIVIELFCTVKQNRPAVIGIDKFRIYY